MFEINWQEALLLVVWLAGVIAAITVYANGRRGLRGALLIAAAVLVPILGALLAITVLVLDSRRHATA